MWHLPCTCKRSKMILWENLTPPVTTFFSILPSSFLTGLRTCSDVRPVTLWEITEYDFGSLFVLLHVCLIRVSRDRRIRIPRDRQVIRRRRSPWGQLPLTKWPLRPLGSSLSLLSISWRHRVRLWIPRSESWTSFHSVVETKWRTRTLTLISFVVFLQQFVFLHDLERVYIERLILKFREEF